MSDDSTLKNNIALGIAEEEIDVAFLNECIDKAKLSDLVQKSTDGINLEVGENDNSDLIEEKERLRMKGRDRRA